MNIISFISSISFFIYLLIGIYVIRVDLRSPTRWLFFLFCISYAFWSGFYAFMSSAPDKETALRLIRHFSFSYIISASIFFHFALYLTGSCKKNCWWKAVLVYIPGIILTAKGMREIFIFSDLIQKNGIWYEINGKSPWSLFYTLYYYLFIIGGLFLIARWGRKADQQRDKKIARLIISSYFATLILVFLNAFMKPKIENIVIPRIPHIITLIWIGSIWYAITMFRFLTLEKSQDNKNPLWDVFTQREREIITLLYEGYTYQQIGEKLFISIHTVKSHVENIYSKAQVRNKSQLLYQLQ